MILDNLRKTLRRNNLRQIVTKRTANDPRRQSLRQSRRVKPSQASRSARAPHTFGVEL